jgi:hypothetical protein
MKPGQGVVSPGTEFPAIVSNPNIRLDLFLRMSIRTYVRGIHRKHRFIKDRWGEGR